MEHLSREEQQPSEDAIKKFGWLQLVLTIVILYWRDDCPVQ